jgi:DNA repair protein RadC
MITLVHNHPTGEVRPSKEDLELTFSIQDRLKKVNVKVHDHFILGGKGGTYSFAENGVI